MRRRSLAYLRRGTTIPGNLFYGSTMVEPAVPALSGAAVASSFAANADRSIEVLPVSPTVTVAAYNTGSWDDAGIRENDGVVYDSTTGLWVCVYTGQTTGDLEYLGIVTSSDQATWTAGSNPISGATQGEDPYIARKMDGTVYRDGAGLAYLFCEEKIGVSGHQGVDLWRSGANVLTGWTRYGRVLDKAASGFGSQDRTSPTVVHDGSQFVMLFEGRNTGNEGEIGYATSADGLSFTANANAIISRGAANSWNSYSVVPDDLVKVGSNWILLVHGASDATNGYRQGRYITSDAPGSWTSSSFAEMVGNPYGGEVAADAPAQLWANDPTLCTYYVASSNALVKAEVWQA